MRDGAIREMIHRKLSFRGKSTSHGFKYRLFYGLPDGTPVIRYDNEKGKGDQRHIGDREEPYNFRNVETLISHFLKDIEKKRRMK